MTATRGSGTFGHFKFEGLSAGQTYIVTISARKYAFEEPVRLVSLMDDVADLNFVATR